VLYSEEKGNAVSTEPCRSIVGRGNIKNKKDRKGQ
jgi:hypothetical protein